MKPADSHEARGCLSPPSRAPQATLASPARESGKDLVLDPTAGDVSLADWSVLLDAVKQRLRASVNASHDDGSGMRDSGSARRDSGSARRQGPPGPSPRQLAEPQALRRTVLECVQALDQLHSTLLHELARRLQLELQVFDGQVALAQAQAELGGRTSLGAKVREPEPAPGRAPPGPDAFSRSRHLALHDALTDLPNRRFFLERLAHGLVHRRSEQPCIAVFSFCVEGFAAIEAEHGPEFGQALLKVVAARWSRVLRPEDMLARLDGAHFACLRLNQGGDAQALSLASSKLLLALAGPVRLAPLTVPLRLSLGMAQSLAGADEALALLDRAEAARLAARAAHDEAAAS
ncbi:GGDEF domain-containing protein [Paucibacter sp. B51]|uniref:GGDEF domain-containing protein n=1 Tax=Paucibacter sp. B51 TaxID=2993315 RepID=UPI0022EC07F4|nr:GGDEF domain-containing protein [Paucibacter sp. B51]